MPAIPEFTDAEMALIRKMSREQKSADEVRIALGTKLGVGAVRARAKKIGVRLNTARLAHNGFSNLYHPDGKSCEST